MAGISPTTEKKKKRSGKGGKRRSGSSMGSSSAMRVGLLVASSSAGTWAAHAYPASWLFGSKVDGRLAVGAAALGFSYWKGFSNHGNVAAVGTGLLTSWLLDKASDMGDKFAAKAAPAPAAAEAAGFDGVAGPAKKLARLEKRMDKLQEIRAKLAAKAGEAPGRPGPRRRVGGRGGPRMVSVPLHAVKPAWLAEHNV